MEGRFLSAETCLHFHRLLFFQQQQLKPRYANCSILISLKIMAGNFILKHWCKQQSVFSKNLEGLKRQDKADTIELVHDLRVATKKLRAYLKLLRILFDKKDYADLFEKTEQLFNILGKHRDIEMGLEGLKSFEKDKKNSYSAFRYHLEVGLEQVWTWVRVALDEYEENDLLVLTAKVEKDLEDKSDDELQMKVKAIVEKEMNKSRRLTNRMGDQPHLIRKLFKDIFYWASLLPKTILAPEQLKAIDKSLNFLGNWQDLEMLHIKIKHFRKDFVPDTKEIHHQLKLLEKTISGKQQRIVDKAKESINTALSH